LSQVDQQLYQAVILEHNKKPRNFRKISAPTHAAEGYNPLCGDHYWVYVVVDGDGLISDVSFEGHGCAISKASASMMTEALRGKTPEAARLIYEDFHKLVVGDIKTPEAEAKLGKLKIFSGIWRYPSRVKCAALSWHAIKGALDHTQTVSTE